MIPGTDILFVFSQNFSFLGALSYFFGPVDENNSFQHFGPYLIFNSALLFLSIYTFNATFLDVSWELLSKLGLQPFEILRLGFQSILNFYWWLSRPGPT